MARTDARGRETPGPREPGPRSAGSRVLDEARFFGRWLRSPLTVGAVTPSSRLLGRAMAALAAGPEPFPEGACVLELGPGTGVVTQCLLERGVPESALSLLEYSSDFADLLRGRFPKARVLEGDAYRLADRLAEAAGGRRVEAVVSSLPLFTRPEAEREALLATALDALPPGRPFVQFSYALTLPVKPERVGARASVGPWIKLNLPPARVIAYRRDAAARPAGA